MALGAMYVTLPMVAAAAAAGIFFFDRNGSKAKELGGGGIQASIGNIVGKAMVEVKTHQMPKLAPQFDGLDCFETLVGR